MARSGKSQGFIKPNTLTDEQIGLKIKNLVIKNNSECCLCGNVIDILIPKGEWQLSFDRIDSDGIYENDNVQCTHLICNLIKAKDNQFTNEEYRRKGFERTGKVSIENGSKECSEIQCRNREYINSNSHKHRKMMLRLSKERYSLNKMKNNMNNDYSDLIVSKWDSIDTKDKKAISIVFSHFLNEKYNVTVKTNVNPKRMRHRGKNNRSMSEAVKEYIMVSHSNKIVNLKDLKNDLQKEFPNAHKSSFGKLITNFKKYGVVRVGHGEWKYDPDKDPYKNTKK